MEKFQEKNLQFMGPLSRLLKGLENVYIICYIDLTNDTSTELNIVKTLLKDPRKAKILLKEKTALLQESESHILGKKFRWHIIKNESSKKQSLEVFTGSNEKNTPFQKGPLL